jgi:hypothetical protein
MGDVAGGSQIQDRKILSLRLEFMLEMAQAIF